jgi:hypothetical protein
VTLYVHKLADLARQIVQLTREERKELAMRIRAERAIARTLAAIRRENQ